MKYLFAIFFLISTVSIAQHKHVNTKKGFAINGYDVVAYFNSSPTAGKNEFVYSYQEVNYKFSSQKNLDIFKINPKKYLPQYGGYCAYAIGKKGKKVAINPETFEIRDHKLYLFYNKGKTNTLELWRHEGAENLKAKADLNWIKINQ